MLKVRIATLCVSVILDLYNAPMSMKFQSLMDSKSPSSGHTSLVDLISSSTLTPLLLHVVPMESDNPSKCFELYNQSLILNHVNVKTLPFDRGLQESAINHYGDARIAPCQSMGSEATFSCFGISCPCWASNCTDVRILPFD